MVTITQEERDWNQLARTENHRCVACGELISFQDREIYNQRRLCAYCAQMIPPTQ
jgi:formylmethanofuran dehydrogenase subunit E